MPTVTFELELPEQLRMWRAYTGLSLREVAARATTAYQAFNPGHTISHEMVRRYETGDYRPAPDTGVLWALAHALDRSPQEYGPDIAERIAVMMTWLTPSLQATA